MGMTKSSVKKPTGGAAKTAGPSTQYLAKGGKVGKKMMTGGMSNPNKAATVSPKMKGGGMYKRGGMKKGK